MRGIQIMLCGITPTHFSFTSQGEEKKMKRLLPVYFLVFSSITFNANAAHNCAGTVNTVDVDASGNLLLNITGIGDGNTVCSLTKQLGEFVPEACKSTLSLALSAKMSGKKVRLYFRNDTNTNCAKGNWVNLADSGIYYFRLED